MRLSLKFPPVDGASESGVASCMLSEMDNPETIFTFLRARSPEGICDDCIARETGVAPRQQISLVARAFGLTSDFDRSMGVCFFCQGEKLVTRSLQDA